MTNNRVKSRKAKSTDKLEEALALLNEAAVEKQNELHENIREQYETLHNTWDHALENGRHAVEEAKERAGEAVHAGEDALKEGLHQADEKVHENPWPALGFAAVTAFLVGYNMSGGQRQKSASRRK